MANESASLVITDITKLYDTVPVLRGVSLSAGTGDSIAIIGPSGSGKSTLLNIIGSLDKPTSGTVTFGGVDVTGLADNDLAAFRSTKVGFVFQDHHLLPQLTAYENVLLPTIPGGKNDGVADKARDLMERMGISHRSDAFPAQMSGGERQRTAVARALINDARLLLCDEPTGSLDRESGSDIVSLLLELAEQRDVTVIVVTHNTEHAARFGRCLELVNGRLEARDRQ
jgi:lipoprotein-releasing system ATP-binding protein